MKTYNQVIQSNVATQTIRSSGKGHISLMTISHSESTAQVVSFYDKDSTLLARYEIAPSTSPATIILVELVFLLCFFLIFPPPAKNEPQSSGYLMFSP